MVAISVDALRGAVLPPDTSLVGGSAGLGRQVTGTATFRARTPAFPALHGGEVAFVSLSLLRTVDPHAKLDRLVTQLDEAGVAAIVLLDSSPGDSVLEDAARAAGACTLPVFAVPAGHSAEALDLALHRQLASHREYLLKRGQELQREFSQLALAGQGLQAIVDRLAAVTGLPAAWEAAGDAITPLWALPPSGFPAALVPLGGDFPGVLRAGRLPLLRWAPSQQADGPHDVATLALRADAAGESSPWRRLVIAVAGAGRMAGFLSLVAHVRHASGARSRQNASHSQGDLNEAQMALTAAALAASIEALRARTVSETQGGAVAGLLHDWLGGRSMSAGDLETRATALGIPLAPPFAVLVVEAEPAPGEDELRRIARLLIAAGPSSAGVVLGPLWTAVGERRLAVIVRGADPTTLDTAARDIHAVLSVRHGGSAIFAGIGRIAPAASDVPRAYGQALQALGVARRLGGQHRAAYFGALGAYRVLAAAAPEEVLSFHEDTLGPLRALDEKSGGELLRTLETYLLCGGSPQETAQRLHAHRNTVLYRLDRIAEALNVDVRDPETQLTLFLALRAADVLGVSVPGRVQEGAPAARLPLATASGAARRK